MSTFCRWCFTLFFVLFLIHYYFSFTSNPIFLTRSLFMKIMFGFSNWILLKKIYLILIYNLFWKCTLKFYSEEYIFILCSGRKNIVLYLWINLILMIYLIIYLIWCQIPFCIINFGNFNILKIVNYNYDFSYFDCFFSNPMCIFSMTYSLIHGICYFWIFSIVYSLNFENHELN